MSVLDTYKEIVSQVYTLTTLVAQGKMSEASLQFDGFLESLKTALDDKEDHSPYLEIVRDVKPSNASTLSERIVVVKDDTMKNIVLRTSCSPAEKVEEDEILDEENANDDADEDTAAAAEADAEAGEDVSEQEEEEEEEEDVEPFELNGQLYYLAPESKRVFKYIDEATPGDQVGKLMNGRLVHSSNFMSPK